MALTDWNSVLGMVAEALAGWGAQVVVGGKLLQELRDFGMDFELDTVTGLPAEWQGPGYAEAVAARYPALVQRLREEPATRQAIIPFPPAPDGSFPCLLQVAFALRHGALDMTIIARATRYPDLFTADVGACLHLQERLAGALDARRGRCAFFCLNLHQEVTP